MTIQQVSTTYVDIYAINQPEDVSGAWEPLYVWQTYTAVAWFPRASEIDPDYKQQRRRREVVLRTYDPAIFALLPEKLSLVVYQGVPYEVESKRDVANQHVVFHVDLKELISDQPIPGPPIGGGCKCGGTATVGFID